MISQRYEPVPSYLDQQRTSYSPGSDIHPLSFDTPGMWEARPQGMDMLLIAVGLLAASYHTLIARAYSLSLCMCLCLLPTADVSACVWASSLQLGACTHMGAWDGHHVVVIVVGNDCAWLGGGGGESMRKVESAVGLPTSQKLLLRHTPRRPRRALQTPPLWSQPHCPTTWAQVGSLRAMEAAHCLCVVRHRAWEPDLTD